MTRIRLFKSGSAWLAALFGLAAFGVAVAQATITVGNYTNTETIGYPVVLLQGTVSDTSLTAVSVTNQSSTRPMAGLTGQAYSGSYKALAELVPGTNQLVISTGGETLPFQMTYVRPTNAEVVRIVYATDNSTNLQFQTPYPATDTNWVGKLRTEMLLYQAFTAEVMNNWGMGRRTFNLEFDTNNDVIVHVMVCDKNTNGLYTIPGGGSGLYSYIDGQIARNLPNSMAKNLVLPAFSWFNPATQQNSAYTALGGGNLALFGGSDMYTYPNSLAEVQTAFMDSTPVPTNGSGGTLFSNDSNGRSVYWAVASTSIGAALHETGHTFGLTHSTDNWDIMLRGFDYFSRYWVMREAPDIHTSTTSTFTPDHIAHWGLASAAYNLWTHWFAMRTLTYSSVNRIKCVITDSSDTNHFYISTPDGIGAVILGAGQYSTTATREWGTGTPNWLATPPTNVVVNALDWPDPLAGAGAWIRIIDTNGNNSEFQLSAVIAGGTDVTPPTTPANVVAAAQSSTSIQITWLPATDNVGVAGYVVYRGDTDNNVGTATGTAFTDTGLTPSTKYSYLVAAVDAAGNLSPPSAPPAFASTPTPDIDPPSTPANFTATGDSSGSLLLQWSPSTDNRAVTGYEVDQNGQFLASVTGLNYEVRGLVASTYYGNFTVRAFDAEGNYSAASAPAGGTTLAPAPALVRESFDYADQASLNNLNGGAGWSGGWSVSTDNANPPVFPATVEAGAGGAGDTGAVGAVGTNFPALVYSVNRLHFWNKGDGVHYENLSRAFQSPINDDGQTVWLGLTLSLSDSKNQVTWTLTGLTTDPTGTNAAYLFSTAANSTPTPLKFNGTTLFTGDSGYSPHLLLVKIQMSGDTNAETVTAYCDPNLGGNPADWTGVTVTNLYANKGLTAFSYAGNRASSANFIGDFYMDEIRMATNWQGAVGLAPDVTPPSTPTNPTATALSANAILLTWSPATDYMGVLNYDVYRNGLLVATVTGTSYTNTGLIDATTYTNTVVARDAAGNASAASAPAIATTLPVFVEETFDSYTAGSSFSGGSSGSGGIGWTNNWTASGATIVAGNLNGLGTGNSLGLTIGSPLPTAGRNWPGLDNSASRTNWLAFWLSSSGVKNTYTLSLNGATNGSMISMVGSSGWAAPTYKFFGTTVVPAATSSPQQFVHKIIITSGGGLTILCYVNPNLGTDATTWTAAATYSQPAFSTPLNGLVFKTDGDSATHTNLANLDAIRLASTWQAAVGQAPQNTQIPTVPTALAATALSSSAIALSWNASTDSLATVWYYVYRGGTNIASVSATSFTDTGLAASTLYSYSVVALDTEGKISAASAPASATTASAATPPQITTIQLTSPTNLVLRWQSVPGQTYKIQFSTNLLTGFYDTSLTDIVATNSLTSMTLTVGPSRVGFYRLGVVP